jgi:hypothetical protein
MDRNSWISTLTIETNPADIAGMRDWLGEHAPPVPSRNSDVLAKFVAHTLISNAHWDGVFAGFRVSRPQPVIDAPWRQDGAFEQDAAIPPPRRWRLALAVSCAFGALTLLACAVAFGR